MLRFIIGIIYLVLFYIVSWPLFIFERILRIFNPKTAARFSFAITKWIVRMISFICSVNIVVKGKENLLPETPVLYISNHEGFFDIVATLAQLPSTTLFIAKKSALGVPLIHGWGTRIHCLALDREDIRQGLKTILSAIEEIKSGYSVFIYPEGTRSKGKGMADFKPGSFKVATKTNCPIIPVAVSGTFNIFEAQMPKVHPGTVYLTFGEPIYTDSLSQEEKKHISKTVQSKVKSMLAEHPQSH